MIMCELFSNFSAMEGMAMIIHLETTGPVRALLTQLMPEDN